MKSTNLLLKNSGLRNKLLLSYITISVVFVMVFAVFFAVHYFTVQRYRVTNEALVLQYQIIDSTYDYIQAYNSAVKSNSSPDALKDYNQKLTQLRGIFEILDKYTTDPESKAEYEGLKNVVNSIISECDQGIREVMQGNFLAISDHYAKANKAYPYVRESTADLVLKELEYSKKVQKAIERTQTIVDIVAISTFLVITGLSIVASISISSTLVKPLTSLTESAHRVANGDMNIKLDKELINAKDEVGTLAKAVDVMLAKIRQNITEMKENNARLAESEKETQQKNEELSRMNKFMVDRELRMIELKEEIERIKNQKS